MWEFYKNTTGTGQKPGNKDIFDDLASWFSDPDPSLEGMLNQFKPEWLPDDPMNSIPFWLKPDDPMWSAFTGGGNSPDPSKPNTNTKPGTSSGLPPGLANILRLLPTGSGSNGSGSLANLLNLFSGDGNGNNSAYLPAALATAYNHYRDSDRYTNLAESYTNRLDPFNGQRGYYQDRLRALTEDPEKFLSSDPGYKSLLRLQVDPAISRMRAKGYGNSGNIMSELTKLSGDVANKYLGDEKNRLLHAAGGDIGPGAAASLLGAGMQGSINSRNAALGDIFSIFGLNNRGTTNNTGSGGGGNTPLDWNALLSIFQGNAPMTSGSPTTTGDPPDPNTLWGPNNPYAGP